MYTFLIVYISIQDEMIPDREEDIRPRFHRSRSHHLSPSGPPGQGGEEDDEDGMDDDSTLSGQIFIKMAGK